MERATKISLLRRKAELVVAIDRTEFMAKFIGKVFSKALDLATRFPRMPDSHLREIDRSLEKMMDHSMLPFEIANVRDPLIKEFGISRLTISPKAIMKRVLKRGTIQTEEEYYQIQELVTFVDNIDELGQEIYWKLEKIAGEFRPKDNYAPIARKFAMTEGPAEEETPRWPMVPPEGDKHLCPDGTPIEILEQYVRAKLELLLPHFKDPDDANNFTSLIEGGIKLVYGPHTRPENKVFQMRYRDHELEAFSGLNVTMKELRTVELKMQLQFGFRRLLPSPRQMGLSAIEAGKIEGQDLRLIIERALHDFTAPPIFSPEETRKLAKLLKAKPPSPP